MARRIEDDPAASVLAQQLLQIACSAPTGQQALDAAFTMCCVLAATVGLSLEEFRTWFESSAAVSFAGFAGIPMPTYEMLRASLGTV